MVTPGLSCAALVRDRSDYRQVLLQARISFLVLYPASGARDLPLLVLLLHWRARARRALLHASSSWVTLLIIPSLTSSSLDHGRATNHIELPCARLAPIAVISCLGSLVPGSAPNLDLPICRPPTNFLSCHSTDVSFASPHSSAIIS